MQIRSLTRAATPVTSATTVDGEPPPPRREPARRWLRVGVGVLLLGLAIYLLLPRVGELRATTSALHHARPDLLVAAFAAVAASFPLSALSMVGAAAADLPLLRTTAVELAGAFLNRVTPAGVGRVGVLSRYLALTGIPPLRAAGVLGLNMAAGAFVHGVGLGLAVALLRPSMTPHVRLPDRWADLLTVVVILVGSGVVIGGVVLRRRWRSLAVRLVPLRDQFRRALTRPSSVAALLGGVAGVNAAMIGALVVSLAAFGAHPPIDVVALVYLGGSAVAAVAPTPGGLGAMEAALVAGLTGFGVASGPAIAGVLAFRLLSWWIPPLIGAGAWAVLRRQQTV